MSKPMPDHLYDVRNFILENGSLADKMRLIASCYDISSDIVDKVLSDIESILNKDGGLPFGLIMGNPSSVKETAEMLTLLKDFQDEHPHLIDRMTNFLVSRQKGNGGFAEALNLDSLIEDRWGMTWGRNWYPVGKSVTWLTGKALEALCSVNFDNEERLRRAHDYLINSQYEDGHWPDYEGGKTSDPIATGNIISGLNAIDLNSHSEVFEGARAALFQHLKDSIESKSTSDMVDLAAAGKAMNVKEREVIQKGIELILESQQKDGGWALVGTKRSDPELTSLLASVLRKCSGNAD